jgi:two-component system, NarL family, response regulator DegU
MSSKISLYIADDHNIVRRGMARLLKSFNRVQEVVEASNGKELIALIKKKVPDAVILDIEMPVMGGIETAKYINEHFPSVKILVLTMHIEEVFISRLMEYGVHGFLSKSSEPEEVERALYSIVDKDFYRNELMDNVSSRRPHLQEEDAYSSKLSTREIEILLLICQELTPGEISERLQISEKTFFNHRANILKKANVRSNVGLLKFARHKGYIDF